MHVDFREINSHLERHSGEDEVSLTFGGMCFNSVLEYLTENFSGTSLPCARIEDGLFSCPMKDTGCDFSGCPSSIWDHFRAVHSEAMYILLHVSCPFPHIRIVAEPS